MMKRTLSQNRIPLNTRLGALLLWTFVMFRYMVGEAAVFILALIVILFACTSRLRLRVDTSDYFWIAYAMILLTFGLIRDDKMIVIKRFLTLLLMIVLKIVLQGNDQRWLKKGLKTLLAMGAFQTAGVLAEVVNPSLIYLIRDRMGIESVFELGRSEVYRSGFTGQPGIAGFCVALFLCVCVVWLIMTKGMRQLPLILAFSGAAAILLTGKRGLFAFSIVCAYIICFLYFTIIKQRGRRLFIMLLIGMIAMLFIARLPIFSANIDRLLHGSDAGRFFIYRFLINNFLSSPVFGVGRDAYTSVMAIGTHNEFLGVLSENGLLGFVFYFCALISPLYKTGYTVVKYHHFINIHVLLENREIAAALLLSIYWQILILAYSMTGNPLTTIEQATSYFAFTAIDLNAVKKLNMMRRDSDDPLYGDIETYEIYTER